MMEKISYITRTRHLHYPAGSECLAYYNECRQVVLEFSDGTVITLESGWFIEGHPSNRRVPVEVIIAETVATYAIQDICDMEDAKFMKTLDDYSR